MYPLGMHLALSHRKAKSQCPEDSFYTSVIASLEVGSCWCCPSAFRSAGLLVAISVILSVFPLSS